jgi:hypothetical protein
MSGLLCFKNWYLRRTVINYFGQPPLFSAAESKLHLWLFMTYPAHTECFSGGGYSGIAEKNSAMAVTKGSTAQCRQITFYLGECSPGFC